MSQAQPPSDAQKSALRQPEADAALRQPDAALRQPDAVGDAPKPGNNGNGNGSAKPALTLDDALKLTTPKGTPLSELDESKLAQIAALQKKDMSDEVKKLKAAAAIVLEARKNAVKA